MWKVTEEPIAEPVSLEYAKAYLRVEIDAEDDEIRQCITDARSYCEEELDLAMVEQEITLHLDHFPRGRAITLPRSNLISVTSLQYRDPNGDQQAYTDFNADTFTTPGRVINANETWPPTQVAPDAVVVVYRAGFKPYSTGETDLIPGAVHRALMMMISHYFDNRNAVLVGQTAMPTPHAVDAALMKYRRMGL